MTTRHSKLLWPGTRVLITGASGFIGSHLAEALRQKGAEVHGVTRTTKGDWKRGERWWEVDLREQGRTRDVLSATRPDIIYHLSSRAHGGREIGLVQETFQSEVVATVSLLSAAAEYRCGRFIMAGSLEEPDLGDAPSSPYAAAKAASRLYGQLFFQLYDVPVVFTRVFMTYGPGQPDWKIIPYCARTLLQGEQPQVESSGRRVDWIYISDVVNGFIALAEEPCLEGRSFDLGTGQLVEIGEVVKMIQKLANPLMKVELKRGSPRQLEQVRSASLAGVTAATGWRPTITLEEGLRLTVDHLRKQLVASH